MFNLSNFTIYFISGPIVCTAIIVLLFFVVHTKSDSSTAFLKAERNHSNERYEIQPGNQHASSPVLDGKLKFMATPTISNSTVYPPNKNTFCTCGGLIHQTCVEPSSRVDSYHNGLTELSKFQDKPWHSDMPYDQFISQQNYENQNTNWQDIMPYDIYESKF